MSGVLSTVAGVISRFHVWGLFQKIQIYKQVHILKIVNTVRCIIVVATVVSI